MFLISVEDLEIGDILLTAESSSISKAVRLSTKSQYSHAILYVGHSSYIHSDSNGVHSGNLQRLLFPLQKNVCVLKVNCGYEQKEKACIFARDKIGTEYSVKEAISSRLHPNKDVMQNRQFCSRLVAQAYEYANVKLVENSSFCTPQEILESSYTLSTSIIARKASEAEIIFATKTHDPIKKQSEITNKILEDVRAVTKKDIQTLNQVHEFLMSFPEYDSEISAIYKESGYLDMWRYEVRKNKWRYSCELFSKLGISPSELKKLALSEIKSAKGRMRLYSSNYNHYLYLRSQYELEYLDIHIELYKNLIDFTTKNINASLYVLSMLEKNI